MLGHLHHLSIGSPEPARLADFYREAMGMRCESLADGGILCAGPQRRMILTKGPANSLAFAGYALGNAGEVAAMRQRLVAAGVPLLPSPTPLFGDDALALRDPDGTLLVFGLETAAETAPQKLAARLEHIVMASPQSEVIARFYADVLGFTESDRVYRDDGSLTTCFLRSDHEHHSFAVFQAPEYRFDHHCYESAGWTDLRDWADHFATQKRMIEWGPGRHGPGNNLFIFVHDPDGNWVELSAELEVVEPNRPTGSWPHAERTLNLWGRAPLRS